MSRPGSRVKHVNQSHLERPSLCVDSCAVKGSSSMRRSASGSGVRKGSNHAVEHLLTSAPPLLLNPQRQSPNPQKQSNFYKFDRGQHVNQSQPADLKINK